MEKRVAKELVRGGPKTAKELVHILKIKEIQETKEKQRTLTLLGDELKEISIRAEGPKGVWKYKHGSHSDL